MKIYTWRHSTAFSSWSVMEELRICNDNYIEAEVSVVAQSEEQALALLEKDDRWNIDDLRQIRPVIVTLDQPAVLRCSIN